jgi:hypothetical protein
MRKVFRGALLVAISGAMVGGFSACKDTQDDYRYEIEQEFTQKLKDTNTSLEELRDAQTAELNKAINNLLAQIDQCNCNPQDIVDLNNAVAALRETLGDSENPAEGTIADKITATNNAVSDLQTQVAEFTNNYASKEDLANYASKEDLEKYATQDQLAAYAKVEDLNNLNTQLTQLEAGISEKIQEALNAALANYATTAYVDSTATAVKDEAKANLDSVASVLRQEAKITSDKLNALVGDYEGTLGDLIDAYKAADKDLQDQIDALDKRITANTKAIEAVESKLAKLVTSVLVQGAYNRFTGAFALPTNIQSNILCAYYGQTDTDIEFPSSQTGNLVNQSGGFTSADITFLKNTGLENTLKLTNGAMIVGDEGNAGKLYITVNPTAVDFDGLSFDLVNSLDEKSGITLSSIQPSTDKLTFGYSRGASANGFYEATATLKKEDISKAKVNVNKSALVSAVKDLYQNKTAANFTNIASTLYNQVNNVLDANAVKAAWTNEDGSANSVYSQYGIAAFAFKPLSFAFDPSFSYTIPNIDFNLPSLDDIKFDFDLGDLDLNLDFDLTFDLNFNLDDFNISVGEISLGEITLDGVNPTVEVTFEYDYPIFEETTIGSGENATTILTVAKDENGNDRSEVHTGSATVSLEDFMADLSDSMSKSINDQISKALSDMIDDLNSSLKEQIKTQLLDQISSTLNNEISSKLNEQINNMATDLNNSINDLLGDLSSEINNQISSTLSNYQSYLDKLQSLIDRVNNVINRVNNINVGDKIHTYLQATLVYEGNSGKYARVSSMKSAPTVFKVSGGNAIILHPTSLSAEIIAPAYKKFVGVTNVFKNSDLSKSAQGGDANCLAAAKSANSAKYIDEVIDGSRYGVPFVGQAGYTYEIAYAALDFQGKVSMRKYYIRVI